MGVKPALWIAAWCLAVAGCDNDPLDPVPRQVPLKDLLSTALAVELDPYGVAPLSAVVVFGTSDPATIAVRVLGPQPVEHSFDEPATSHVIPILGLYPDAVNSVEIRVTDAALAFGVDTIGITTGPLPDFFPTVEIVTMDESRMETGWTLSSLSFGVDGEFESQPIMFDANGVVRWYLDLSRLGMVYLVERFANGNLLTGAAGTIYEYDMLGNQVNSWEMPGYDFHHDVIEKPDGNLLVAVNRFDQETIEDHVIELDRNSGAVISEWDLREVLDVDRFDYEGTAVDWFHMNAVSYSEPDDALIVSGRNQAVVKVTRENELMWILGPHQGWGRAGLNGDGEETSAFLLTAVDANGVPYPDAVQQGTEDAFDFRWPWGQHAPGILPNGNLFLFDNGSARNFGTTGERFSRGVEYEIDESAMTVRQVWQYGEERGAEFYSAIISDVDFLPLTENRLIMPGILFGANPHAFVTEVTYPEGQVVFEAKISFRNLRSSGELGWGQFDLVYRSERLTPYPQ